MTAALRFLAPGLRISALGGPAMERAGAEIVADAASLAIMGFSEVVAMVPTLLQVRRRIWRHLVEQEVDSAESVEDAAGPCGDSAADQW